MTSKMRETDLSKKDLQVFEYILQHGKDIVSIYEAPKDASKASTEKYKWLKTHPKKN